MSDAIRMKAIACKVKIPEEHDALSATKLPDKKRAVI